MTLLNLGLSFFLTATILCCSSSKVSELIKKRINNLKKQKKLDILNKNHLLTFGLSKKYCDLHKKREFDCGNLDCNYGRLSYVLGLISNCQKSIDVSIYIITAKLFGDCILKAFERGIVVRVIADSDMSFSAQSLINTFRKAEISIRQRVSPYIMHHKYVIVDNEVLINGSMNFTMTGAFCNWENVMITTTPALVDSFQVAFNKLWKDFSPLNYSPTDRGVSRSQVPHHQATNV